jgi:hypothetical protein
MVRKSKLTSQIGLESLEAIQQTQINPRWMLHFLKIKGRRKPQNW